MKEEKSPAPATKPCRVCGEDIKPAARKCIHCQGWQNAGGEVSSILTVSLPMLVAILSLSIAAIPIIREALTPANSIISGHFQTSSENFLTGLITNAGGRPGTVNSGSLEIPVKNTETWDIAFDIEDSGNSGAILVPPNNSVLVLFKPEAIVAPYSDIISPASLPLAEEVWHRLVMDATEASTTPDATIRTSRDCTFSYQFSNFDGSVTTQDEKIECQPTLYFIAHLQKQKKSDLKTTPQN